jgi:hypothetical protein
MDNASWIKLNGTLTPNVVASPDGYINADKFVPDTTSSVHALRSNLFNQSATASHSWFVKADGYSKIAVRESELVGNYASFNLATGTLISTNQTGSIVNYGNGWYRCTLVDTTTGVNAQTSVAVLPDSYTSGDPIFNWSGDGTKGIYAYGAQVELGAYATSYVPTLGAASTRGGDGCLKTGISSLIGQTEGVLFIDFSIIGLSGAQWVCFLKGAAGDYVGFYTNGSNLVVEVSYTGTAQFLVTTYALTANTRYKMALAYKANDFAFYANGVQVAVDLSGSVPSCSEFDYNFNTSASNLGANKYNQSIVFPTRLSNAELAQLTTI